MYGGKFLGNIFRKDENKKEYFYETNIKVKDKEYKINYFIPNNFLFVKQTDNVIITPKFFIHTDKKSNTPANTVLKIGKYVVNIILKIQNDWYVIIENIVNLNMKSYYYKIKPGIFTNDNEKLYIKKNEYKKEKNSFVLNEHTYEDANKDISLIIFNFEVQQNAKALGKEQAAAIVAIEGLDYLLNA